MKTSQAINSWYDIIIVGARLEGAAVALLLARAGLRVLAIDRGNPGLDTVSSLALTRGGVMQLNRWGILGRIAAAGAPPISSTTFHYGAQPVSIPTQERDNVAALYAPRRWLLDSAIVDAARAAGAQFAFRAGVREIMIDRKGRIRGLTFVDEDGVRQSVSAELVIGADGVDSTVAKGANARFIKEGRFASSLLYGYWGGLDLDGIHWMYGNGVAAGAIPTNCGQTCVFAAMRPVRFRQSQPTSFTSLFNRVIAETNPGFAAVLRQVSLDSSILPFAGRPGYLRKAWGPGCALVGEASHFQDPLTAHGITDALRDADLLARAIIRAGEAGLADYQSQRDHFAQPFLELSDRVASFDWTLEQLQELHRQLGELMKKECELISNWESPRRDSIPQERVEQSAMAV